MTRTLGIVAVLLAACGGTTDSGSVARVAAACVAAPAGPHEVVVLATASLARPFAAIAARYEREHAGSKVTLRCEGGAALLAAVNAGEPCDVLAIGDSSLMSRFAAAAHLAPGSPTELARSRLAIAVAKGNPKHVLGLADFGRTDVRVALGERSSSIGRHSRWVLSRTSLDPQPTCMAPTADGVLQLVAAGEADAGLVYATSFAGAADTVARVDLADGDNTPVLYSISTARMAREPRGAVAFRALALGPAGQQLLRDAGFLPIGAKLDAQ
jgi:molybdate transport system substrate-binding protein